MSTTTFRPATERQLSYLRSLRAERPTFRAAHPVDPTTLSSREASRMIDALLRMPKEVRPLTPTQERLIVPAGHYAVDGVGHQPIDFYRVDVPTEGKYAGRMFVKLVIGGQPDRKVYGQEGREVLARIQAAGFQAAALRYAQEIGRCCVCNRHLTDELSRELGIGPDCRQNRPEFTR